MKLSYFLIAVVIFVAFIGGFYLLAKAGAKSYSPMENYANAVVKESADSARAANKVPYCSCSIRHGSLCQSK